MDLDSDTFENIRLQLVTSNRTYQKHWSGLYYSGNKWCSFEISAIADMGADDTVYVKIYGDGGTKTIDMAGGATLWTSFSGALLC